MVIFKKPADIRFGVTPIPGNETAILPYDTTSFIVPDWTGYDITAYRAGATFMVPDEDYSWDKTTATFTLLDPLDKFYFKELLHVEFEPLQVGTNDLNEDECGGGCGCGDFSQYPHTLRYTERNQVTLVTDSHERRGRLEEGGSTIQGINEGGNNITAIFYMSLPACPLAIGQQVEIYDKHTLLVANTVKNYVKGFFNARIWL